MKYPYSQLFKISLVAPTLIGLSIYLPAYFVSNISNDEMISRLVTLLSANFLLWQINLLTLKLTNKYDNTYLRFFVSFLFTFLVILIIKFLIETYFVELKGQDNFLPKGLFLIGVCCNIIILFIVELILMTERKKIVQNENNQLRIKNLEAQQQQLKQQIQPHFLFNSLNTLKSLISIYPNEAEEYLVKLSSLLRYNLKSHTSDVILLHEELKICSDYLEMQKVRFKEALQYTIQIDHDDHKIDTYLPIFAIQLLVENAIKHNVLTIEKKLIIEIIIRWDTIRVSNNLQEKFQQDGSTQIGLKNLSERYKLLKQKDIEIIKTAKTFEVLLPL